MRAMGGAALVSGLPIAREDLLVAGARDSTVAPVFPHRRSHAMTPQPNAHDSSSEPNAHQRWAEYFTRGPVGPGGRDSRAARAPSSPTAPASGSAVPQADGTP